MGERSLTPKNRRWLVSYRISLTIFLPFLIAVTGALLSLNAYVTGAHTIDVMTEHLFREISRQTVQEATAHVGLARPAVDLLAQTLGDARTPPGREELEAQLLAVARANPSFAWVSYGAEDGSFVGVHRLADGRLVLNTSTIADGKTHLIERYVGEDGTTTPLREQADTGYDPRGRPFYTLAKGREGRVWTKPYVFYESGVPGITCARAVRTRTGDLRGVVTVDFDLNVLSEFVGTLRLSENAEIFVYTDDDVILAHPHIRLAERWGARDAGELVTAENVPSDVVRGFFAARPSAAPTPDGHLFPFDFREEEHIATVAPIRVDEDIRWTVAVVAPRSDFTAVIDRNNRIALAISAISVLFAVLVAAWMSNRVARPLERVAEEMTRVGRLELTDTALPDSPFREIHSMTRALEGMKGGLRSFASYVPRDVVRALMESGEEAKLGGRLGELTIFFSDLAGFTTLAESTSPNDLVLTLGTYFDEATRVIAARGGTVDKFIGDGIMAFWGAPRDEPEHAALACEAAVEMLARIEKLKEDHPALRPLVTRVGVATGEVLVGNIGSSARLNYTVMGDPVNLAARLEGLNKVYGSSILVGESTYERAKDRLLMRPIDVVAVKGKAKSVRVYQPLAKLADADDRAQKIADLSARAFDAYVARDFEGAVEAYDAVLAIAPGDEPSARMRARAVDLVDEPPPPSWDGVFVAKEK